MEAGRGTLGRIRRAALAGGLAIALLAAGGAQAALAAGGGAALVAYIDAVNKARTPYLTAGPAFSAALGKASGTPDATWLAAAAKGSAAVQATVTLGDAVKSISPPSGLAQANGDLLDSTQVALQILTQFTSALKEKNAAAFSAAEAKISAASAKIDALEKEWRTAVEAAASKAGVKVPGWVTTLGST